MIFNIYAFIAIACKLQDMGNAPLQADSARSCVSATRLTTHLRHADGSNLFAFCFTCMYFGNYNMVLRHSAGLDVHG